MIIGISGYSGSGKNAIGSIIQYLFAEKNGVVLAEPVEIVAADPSKYELELDDLSEWEIRKFAGKLKDIASHLTGIDIEDFEDQDFKKTNLGREWWTTCDEGWQPMTVRDFLQKLGTDALRMGLHENVWVNALMVDYKREKLCDCEKECRCTFRLPNWIITDVRFPNEAQAIKDKGGIIIRVDRPFVKPINDHPSEVSLDNWKFDYKIANASDLYALRFTVENILKLEKLL